MFMEITFRYSFKNSQKPKKSNKIVSKCEFPKKNIK